MRVNLNESETTLAGRRRQGEEVCGQLGQRWEGAIGDRWRRARLRVN
jgi:hypothetical protein